VPEHSLHFGPRTSITTPLRSKGLEFRSPLLLHFEIRQQSRPWECGNPEEISKECGKGGKPTFWLSMLSILCHFHGLLWKRVSEDHSHREGPSLGTGTTCPKCRLLVQVPTSELRMGLWPTHRDENRVEPEARCDFRRSCRQSYRNRSARFWYASKHNSPVPNKTTGPGSGVVSSVPAPDDVNMPLV
jgi:hypothetical protein